MKLFVSKRELIMTLLAAIFFALMLVFETGKALTMVLALALIGMAFKIDENPPRWLLRTPLGRRWRR